MHGGDIYRNKIAYDFSVNINPLGIPDMVLQGMMDGLSDAMHYPDMKCEELKREIAKHFKEEISEKHILCGNGASELLMAVCHGLTPKTALLAAPGFSGYEHALRAVDCKIHFWYAKEGLDFAYENSLLDKIITCKPELVVLANPSNPVGTVMKPEFARQLLLACEKAGSVLLLDECFVELSDQAESMVFSLSSHPSLLILRAFTKSFAIPGIRLGYLLGSEKEILAKIEKHLPEWNVSLVAQRAGVLSLKEMKYIKKAVLCISKERDYLMTGLSEMGVKVYSSSANFLLFHWPYEEDLYGLLLREGILIRDCSDYEGLSNGYYRIAVRNHEENEKLICACKAIL